MEGGWAHTRPGFVCKNVTVHLDKWFGKYLDIYGRKCGRINQLSHMRSTHLFRSFRPKYLGTGWPRELFSVNFSSFCTPRWFFRGAAFLQREHFECVGGSADTRVPTIPPRHQQALHRASQKSMSHQKALRNRSHCPSHPGVPAC